MAAFSDEFGSISPELLARVRRYEPDAWEAFVKLVALPVYRWCRVCDLDAQAAADMTLVVFQGAARAIGNFRREPIDEGLRTWLWSATRSRIKGYFRRDVSPSSEDEVAQRIAALPDSPPAAGETGSIETEPEFQAVLLQIVEIGRAPTFGIRQRGRGAQPPPRNE
jgi:DNA-directed RNA polymerase specialized sigma24 family protein